jgi:hypothetical protein
LEGSVGLIVSAFILLGLVIMIPSYGAGYLLNTLAHRWWLALPTGLVVVAVIAGAAGARLSGMEWFALGAGLAGMVASSLTVLQFRRGTYQNVFSQRGRNGR